MEQIKEHRLVQAKLKLDNKDILVFNNPIIFNYPDQEAINAVYEEDLKNRNIGDVKEPKEPLTHQFCFKLEYPVIELAKKEYKDNIPERASVIELLRKFFQFKDRENLLMLPYLSIKGFKFTKRIPESPSLFERRTRLDFILSDNWNGQELKLSIKLKSPEDKKYFGDFATNKMRVLEYILQDSYYVKTHGEIFELEQNVVEDNSREKEKLEEKKMFIYFTHFSKFFGHGYWTMKEFNEMFKEYYATINDIIKEYNKYLREKQEEEEEEDI